MATALAALAVAPGVALAEPAGAQAATAANCSDALGHVVDAVGIIPGSGPFTGLANTIQGFTGNWDCSDENLLKAMIEIAAQQAELVYDENTLEIFGNQVDDQVAVLDGLSYPENLTDDNRKALVDDLDGVAKALGVIEQVGRTRSFRALPAMSALAAVKLSTTTLAIDYETLRVGKWRTLYEDWERETDDSLSYLNTLEDRLDTHIQERFIQDSETISTTCITTSCTVSYRVYAFDRTNSERIWQSSVLTFSGVSPDPSQSPAYQNAVAAASSHIAAAKTAVHNAYITSDYLAIKAALEAHDGKPKPALFHTRGPICNPDQYAILRPVDRDLAVTAVGGPVDESPLALSGTLVQAQDNDSAQFQLIRYGQSFFLRVRGSDLTVNVRGGSSAGNQLKLYGDQEYAQDHPESLFHVYLNWDDELILKVSDRDLTVGLTNGERLLRLNKTLAAAELHANSRFDVTCYPEARHAA